ncbi:MAG: hypothetical protein JXQ23_03415 [Clostridia bacterium]|nr:hypothetical protein [Clostridia bacterium]
MTGKENLQRAISFGGPEHLPVQIDINYEWLNEKNNEKTEKIENLRKTIFEDMIVCGYHAPERIEKTEKLNEKKWFDEWNVGWIDDGHGARTFQHPLEKGYHLINEVSFPEGGNEDWFISASERYAKNKDKYKVGTVWFTLFERLWMLRGFNNMLMDPYLDYENFALLQEKVLEFNLKQIDNWIKLKADAVYFSDDWGSQRTLLMNPEDWRRIYKPAYKKMFRKVRDNHMNVFMHLCGNVIDILPDLIDIGLNVLNPVQPQAMNIDELSRRFGGYLCFYGGVDVQGTMVNGTKQEVKDEVHHLIRQLGKFGGGYIGGTSHSIMPETPLDNIIAMLEAFNEYQ